MFFVVFIGEDILRGRSSWFSNVGILNEMFSIGGVAACGLGVLLWYGLMTVGVLIFL